MLIYLENLGNEKENREFENNFLLTPKILKYNLEYKNFAFF